MRNNFNSCKYQDIHLSVVILDQAFFDSCRIATEAMVAFFLFPSAFADQRQLYQAGFMAPYANTYSPVDPEMMYASQNMYASPEYVPAQYAYPAAYPVYEQETSDNSWSTVAMLAVAGAVGVSIGYTKKAVEKAFRVAAPVQSRNCG